MRTNSHAPNGALVRMVYLKRESLPRESVVVRRLLKAESLYTYYKAWAYKPSSVRDYRC